MKNWLSKIFIDRMRNIFKMFTALFGGNFFWRFSFRIWIVNSFFFVVLCLLWRGLICWGNSSGYPSIIWSISIWPPNITSIRRTVKTGENIDHFFPPQIPFQIAPTTPKKSSKIEKASLSAHPKHSKKISIY